MASAGESEKLLSSIEHPRQAWTPRLESAAPSKHQGIFDALVADIANGRLGPGDRLPSQRGVARALGVDLTTVTKAFGRAREQGIIEAAAGRGSFVSAGAAFAASRPQGTAAPVDLSRNSPPDPAGLDLHKAIVREIGRAFSGDADGTQFAYQDTGGNRANRSAGAVWLSRRMGTCPPERIVLSSGAQTALFSLCHLLCRGARRIAVGEFAYPGIHTIAFQQGLKLAPLAMDGEGIVPAAFEAECKRALPDLLYITPTIDNPTTASMPEGRRREIVALARRHGVAVVEDDPYSELVLPAPVALAALAPDIVWHVATLSKCVTPALRLAYVAAPTVEGAAQLASSLQAMTMMTSPLMAAIASRWIYSGAIKDIVAAMREENAARQEVARQVLDGQPVLADPFGPHMWLPLPEPRRGIEVVHEAERLGVTVLAGSSFAPRLPVREAIRVSLGAAPDRESLERALKVLRGILAAPQPGAMLAMV